jgi:poly(A) polymerase
MADRFVKQLAPFPWMAEPGVTKLMAALGQDRARFVGGAVRDSILGRAVLEIDVATSFSPEEVTAKLAAAGIAVIPTGLPHGTVTAPLAGRRVEITTLRRDVETDGRHARIAPVQDWDQDARRRDFTMNALYLDVAGKLYDPVGGLADLEAGRVRFIGDAETRIREDVLRLLRFYRFFAHYGKGTADSAARAACRKLVALLAGLSAERVQAELLKLLAAPDPVPALRLLAADGVLAAILPEAGRFEQLERLIALEPEPDPLRRLGALVATDKAGAAKLGGRLRLSNDAVARLEALTAPPWPIDPAGGARQQRRALYRLGRELYRDLVLLSGDAARAPALLDLAARWAEPVFPLKGGDVAALGVPEGPEVGRRLAELERWWEEADFAPDRAACLAELRRRGSP